MEGVGYVYYLNCDDAIMSVSDVQIHHIVHIKHVQYRYRNFATLMLLKKKYFSEVKTKTRVTERKKSIPNLDSVKKGKREDRG